MVQDNDKIFFNSFYESYGDGSPISFDVDDFAKVDSYDTKMDEEKVYEKIMEYFEADEKLKKYITPNKERKFSKISKLELNEIYSFCKNKFNQEYLIEIFSVLVEILDLNQSKFYESLSNTFKDELIKELRTRGFLQKNYRLF